MSDPTRWAEGGLKDPTQHPAYRQVRVIDAEAAVVAPSERRSKVAMVGFASSTRDAAPFDDPTYEVWGLNQLYRYTPRADRWFEIHTREVFEKDLVRDTDYVGWLRAAPMPVYMTQTHPDIPMSVRYPAERIMAAFSSGRDYFTSTPSFMVALALLEGFTTIGVYGIDLIVGREYEFEKCCMEYWLGVAQGRGVTLEIPTEAALLKQTHRYGYQDSGSFMGPLKRSLLESRLRQYHAKRHECLTSLNNLDGAIQEAEALRDLLQIAERGGTIPTE